MVLYCRNQIPGSFLCKSQAKIKQTTAVEQDLWHPCIAHVQEEHMVLEEGESEVRASVHLMSEEGTVLYA